MKPAGPGCEAGPAVTYGRARISDTRSGGPEDPPRLSIHWFRGRSRCHQVISMERAPTVGFFHRSSSRMEYQGENVLLGYLDVKGRGGTRSGLRAIKRGKMRNVTSGSGRRWHSAGAVVGPVKVGAGEPGNQHLLR